MSDFSKREQKINLLLVAAGLNIGGAEVVIEHLIRTIDRRRFNVSVCCIKVRGIIGDKLARDGIDIVSLSSSGESEVDYFTFRKLLRLIRLKQIDVVHTHTTDALSDAAVCKFLMPRFKLIHTFHFGNYPHQGRRLMWMECIFSRLANRLIAVGEVQRQQLKSVYHFRDRKIGRVWNGVTIAPTRDDGSFRACIGAENCVLIGTIAKLIKQKGLPEFLAVARQFRDAGDKVRFVIVGDGPMRPELEAMRREFGLDDIVVITGWVVNAAVVALPAFDVFFQPSLWEAMSVAILEAMAAGKPVVGTRVGENPHIIKDGEDGLLVEPKDVKGMALSLDRLIDDVELRCRLGNAAAQKVAQQFTVERMTRTYEEIYLEML